MLLKNYSYWNITFMPPTSNRLPDNDQIIFDVLASTGGVIKPASIKLGVTPDALYKWIRNPKYPSRKDTYQSIKFQYADSLLDLVETALERNLKAKSGHVSNKAAETTLKYLGKSRGYVPANYVESVNNDEVRVTVVRKETPK